MKVRGNERLIEILSQANSLEELDVKSRLRLQEALVAFLRDQEKWSLLPPGEMEQLLKRLTTQPIQFSSFRESLEISYQNQEGENIIKKLSLDFDTVRNKGLGSLLEQIVNQQIAVIFQENFCLGLIDHLQRLISMELELKELDEQSLEEDYKQVQEGHTLSFGHINLEDRLPSLSPQDIYFIRRENLGIMVQLIPKFVRLPLNKLYYSIIHRAPRFPSLTLQFYLGQYLSARLPSEASQYTVLSQQLIQTFFTKAFYGIHRLGGLTVQDLNQPEAKRFERFQYITINDEDPTPVIRLVSTGVERLGQVKQKLERLRRIEEDIRNLKKRQYALLMERDITLESTLEDFFNHYRERIEMGEEETEPLHSLSLNLWLPQYIFPLAPWDRENLEEHLRMLMTEETLSSFPKYERELIESWDSLAEEAIQLERTVAFLERINYPSLEAFRQEILLRLAQQQKLIIEQNIQLILDRIGQQITRMYRLGSLTPATLVKQRYKDLQVHVLPYIYYFETLDPQQNCVWIRSPYPFAKLIYLIRLLENPSCSSSIEIKGNSVDLSISLELLRELLSIEYEQLESSDDEPDTQAPDEVEVTPI